MNEMPKQQELFNFCPSVEVVRSWPTEDVTRWLEYCGDPMVEETIRRLIDLEHLEGAENELEERADEHEMLVQDIDEIATYARKLRHFMQQHGIAYDIPAPTVLDEYGESP